MRHLVRVTATKGGLTATVILVELEEVSFTQVDQYEILNQGLAASYLSSLLGSLTTNTIGSNFKVKPSSSKTLLVASEGCWIG